MCSIRLTGRVVAWVAVILVLGAGREASAQTFGADFAADYSFVDLGGPAGVPTNLGGVNFKPGDLNTLLIGGSANTAAGAIYEIGVTRDADNHIIAFDGAATKFADATNIDGGLVFAPNGTLLFTGYNNNILGQIKPGSTAPDKIINLTGEGIASSVGAIQFVPAGFAGAGQFKVASYTGDTWYTVQLVPDGDGTFDIGTVSASKPVSGGPEGIVYIDSANAGFDADSVLIAEWEANLVGAYEIDGNGDPILATRRNFISGLSGAEGALIDPLTGDFIFSTFGGGNRVIVVQGFIVPPDPQDPGDPGVIPTPSAAALGAMMLGLLAIRRSRR